MNKERANFLLQVLEQEDQLINSVKKTMKHF